MNYRGEVVTEAEKRIEHYLFWLKVKALSFLLLLVLFIVGLFFGLLYLTNLTNSIGPQHPEFPNWYANCGVTRGYWYDEYNGFTEYLTEDEFTEYCQ